MPSEVFISAVTSEFGSARDAIASDLRSRGCSVKTQQDFRQEAGADTTLQKLHDYIRDCYAVVCLLGARSGDFPTETAAARFARMLPPSFTEASYTQWEFFFARHHKRRLSIYIAKEEYPRDALQGDGRPGLQKAFLHYIVEEQGLDHDYVESLSQLRPLILREDWPHITGDKPVVLPYPSLGALFKGRDEFLRRLHASLKNSGKAAIVSLAVHGLGGTGKTRAAVEYAWAYAAEYSASLFAIADTPQALARNLAALAAPLGLAEAAVTEEYVRVAAVVAWLNEHPGWFLILDNVDTREALAAATSLLGRLKGGHVAMTGRLANFGGEFEPVELDVLADPDAVAFLIERTHRRVVGPEDAELALALAKDLGGLALALEHAGAYINWRRIGFAQYRELWRLNWNAVAEWFDEAVTHYPRALAATWQTSVVQLNHVGRALLERLAFLAPEPIPEFLLDVPVAGVEAIDLLNALVDLDNVSLVRRNPDRGTLTVHRLVQETTRRRLDPTAARRRFDETLNWIEQAFAGDPEEVSNWSHLDPLAPHAHAVVVHAEETGHAQPAVRLMDQLGRLLTAKASYIEAEPLLRRSLGIIEQSSEPEDGALPHYLGSLAELLRQTNRPLEAERLYSRAVKLAERIARPNDPARADYLNNLGELFFDTNRPAEAETVHRRALEINEQTFGPNHHRIATNLTTLPMS